MRYHNENTSNVNAEQQLAFVVKCSALGILQQRDRREGPSVGRLRERHGRLWERAQKATSSAELVAGLLKL